MALEIAETECHALHVHARLDRLPATRELMPKHLRGRAFAVNQVVQFTAVPFVALVAWILVPRAPLGAAGWRWVVLVGSVSAILVWFIRRTIPESPRWLASRGRLAEAELVTASIERRVAAELGTALPDPATRSAHADAGPIRFRRIFSPPHRSRTLMLMVFNFAQTIGYYGFASWVPTLVIGFLLGRFGVSGVFAFIAGAMVVAGGSIALAGPRTSGRSLEDIA